MKTIIALNNMSFYAYHGVLPAETITGNEFIVNLKIEYDFRRAFESDDVKDTLNYAEAYDLVKREMMIPSKLLEHVAGRIYHSLKAKFVDAKIIELRVGKMHPPVNGEAEMSEIIIGE